MHSLADRRTRAFREWLKYAWRIPVLAAFLWAAVLVQLFWVLKVPQMTPEMYIVPTVVSLVFGIFWSTIAYYRDRVRQERLFMQRLAEDSQDVLILRTRHQFIFLSPRIEQLTGYPVEVFELTPAFWEQLIYAEDKARWQAHQEDIWQGEVGKCRTLEFRLMTPMKGVFWVRHEVTCFEYEGEWVCRCVLRDISAERSLKEALEQIQHVDSITQLPNRMAFMACLQAVESQPLSVVMLDILNMQQINQQYGVEMGDAVLMALAERLKQLQAEHDKVICVARWVGDNFVVAYAGQPEQLTQWWHEKAEAVVGQPVFYAEAATLVDVRLRYEVLQLLGASEAFEQSDMRKKLHAAYVRLHRL